MYLSTFGFFVRSFVCLCVCLCACRSACMYSENRHDIDPHGAPNRCKSDPKIDPWTPKVAPKSTPRRPTSLQNRSLGVLRGVPGALLGVCSKQLPSTFHRRSRKIDFGPQRAQKEPKGPPKRFIGSTRRPRKLHLSVFLAPQNDE